MILRQSVAVLIEKIEVSKLQRGYEDMDQEKVILFMKNNNDVPIDGLSTGEKQIVFGGAYLLKNSGNMDDGVAFIDEPELSMHPLCQQK